jgi:hypothetical protein
MIGLQRVLHAEQKSKPQNSEHVYPCHSRHCEERSDEAIHSFFAVLDCFAEPVIGRAFARPVGSQ